MEFEGEKKEPKRVTLSLGETAIVLSQQKSEGKVLRPKMIEILFAKDQKDQSMEEMERFSLFH